MPLFESSNSDDLPEWQTVNSYDPLVRRVFNDEDQPSEDQPDNPICYFCDVEDSSMNEMWSRNDNTRHVCNDCVQENTSVQQCYECEIHIHASDTYRPGSILRSRMNDRGIPHGEHYCQDCFNSITIECEWCQEELNVGSGYQISTENNIICTHCAEGFDTCRCYTCGYYMNIDNAHYLEASDQPYCGHCIDEAQHQYESRIRDELQSYSTRVDGNRAVSNTPGDIVKSLRAYGVEVECYAPDRTSLQEIKNHEVADNLLFKRDGSLNSGGIEIVTDPIAGDVGENILNTLSGLLIDKHFSVDHTCGLHVHIDMSDVIKNDSDQHELQDKIEMVAEKARRYRRKIESTPDPSSTLLKHHDNCRQELEKLYRQTASVPKENIGTVKKLMAIYIACEGIIMSLVPASRRRNNYCRAYAENYNLEQIMSADSIHQLEELHYSTEDYGRIMSYKDSTGGNNTKYRGINFHSMFADGHYEVRMHTGTINSKKMLHWIALHTAIADYSRKKDMTCIEKLMSQPDIKSQTEVLFECLDLPDKTRRYLKARQQKFASDSLKKSLYHDEIDHLLDGIIDERELENEDY